MTQSHHNHTMWLAQRLCQTNSVRFTNKRKQVLQVLVDAKKALSAYELTKLYNQRFDCKIIATSVYRILECLIELRIAYRLDTINKFIACKNTSHHNENRFPIFVICVQCNDVSEHFAPYSIMRNMQALADTPRFRVIDSKIELKGVCKTCEHTSHATTNGDTCEQNFERE